jgi:hypothetical protein
MKNQEKDSISLLTLWFKITVPRWFFAHWIPAQAHISRYVPPDTCGIDVVSHLNSLLGGVATAEGESSGAD